jgi:hypothetical protein
MLTLLYIDHIFDIEYDAYDYGMGLDMTQQHYSTAF